MKKTMKGFTVLIFAVLMMLTPLADVVHMFGQALNINTSENIAYADEELRTYSRRDRCENVVTDSQRVAEASGDDEDVDTGGVSVQEDAWLIRGTNENAVAQEVFDAFTQGHGTSGAFAVGVITNIQRESRFVPDRAEFGGPGGYEVLRFGMNNPSHTASEGPGPKFKTSYPSTSWNPNGLGGGGLFQFTPYTKFTDSQWWQFYDPEGWGVQNQVAHVWHESITHDVMTYVASTSPTYGAGLYGRTPAFTSLEDWLSTTDPEKAAEAFMVGHLRPARYHPDNVAQAPMANSVFNRDNVPADPSLWGDITSPDGDRVIDSNLSTAEENQRKRDEEECGEGFEDNRVQHAGGWGLDYTGSHQENLTQWGSRWRPDALPDYLWEYAIDPRDLGMEFSRTTGWGNAPAGWVPWRGTFQAAHDYNQCTDLAVALTYVTWHKDGQPNERVNGGYGGHGRVTAARLAELYSGRAYESVDPRTLTFDPSQGAAFSTPGGPYGHTGTVSHVFENGDALLIEQNATGFSGQANNEYGTWNYWLMSKSAMRGMTMQFYSPAEHDWVPNALLTGGATTTPIDIPSRPLLPGEED